MGYPIPPDLKALAERLTLYAQLKHERGAAGIDPIFRQAERALKDGIRRMKALPEDRAQAAREPDALPRIRALRPPGPRRIWNALDTRAYADRLQGALLGRFAGCTLGAPVEFWPVEQMEQWAAETGDAFPPTDYWSAVPSPHVMRYGASRCDAYTRSGIDGVPVDDDITYTLLGLLIAETYGPGFTVEDAGKAWLKYLPMACTAEAVALANLRKGVPAAKAGHPAGNPYCEWIGADIRADPWGYLAPGWPERAAGMAWRDARLSHRRQGLYGAMFFAAAIAAAFTVDHPVRALELGLTEIPRDCALARAVRWALRIAPRIHSYREARAAVDRRFKGMSGVHTINNACLVVWGLAIGGTDFTKVISETVAMGLDNDCTAATAGSICGAVVGRRGIPAHWYRPFANTVRTYMIGRETFAISDLFERFTRQAHRVHASAR